MFSEHVELRTHANDNFVKNCSHGGDVDSVISNEFSQRFEITANVPMPQQDRFGAVHIGQITPEIDIERVFDCLLPAFQTNSTA